MFRIALAILGVVAFGTLGTLANPIPEEDASLTIRIVHTNDMHARFEQTSKFSSPCTPEEEKNGQCYGGFARIATLVRQARQSDLPSLFLNAGDTYQGTIWYNIYKWKIVSQFLNILAPDAVSLGNHEFDDGVDGLVPFINSANFPVLTANLDLSEEPTLEASQLQNSTILTVKGVKIGVIGYLTPETKLISVTGKVVFKDEVECIREEAKKLKSQGVNILIALGHSGFDVDKKIAEEVEDIDLVIGGHTNTFLYNGKQPDIEVPEGLYPTEVVQKTGRKTYVVQAYAYTKYLGNFTVSFDSQGEITHIQGNPILVDSRIEQAKDILDELDKLRDKVIEYSKLEVGQTRVLLDGDSKTCRRQECNMGNIITDAMIDIVARENVVKDGWTVAAIAVQNSGSIRTSISRSNNDKVTMENIASVLPFHNVMMKVTMTGKQILSMLEWSVSRLDLNATSNLYGAYLQVSGLQVVYDINQPPMSRVVSVYAQCAACKIPQYEVLREDAKYKVLVSDFLYNGGDGYTVFEGLESQLLGITTEDALVNYFQQHSPVHSAVEWRITYANAKQDNENDNNNDKDDNGNNASDTLRFNNLVILIPVILQFFTR